MLILGIETSNIYLSISIEKDGEPILNHCEKVPMRHSEVIFPRLSEFFDKLKMSPADLDRIGVSIGPGMFTALRIGLALTKGIAFAHKIPVVPINTLDALALPYLGQSDYVMPLIDARRGLLYTAMYSKKAIQTDYLLIKPEGLNDLIEKKTTVLGDGVEHYQEVIRSLGKKVAVPRPNPIFPEAKTICQLARERNPVPIEDLEPFYIKKSDAEIDHPERYEDH